MSFPPTLKTVWQENRRYPKVEPVSGVVQFEVVWRGRSGRTNIRLFAQSTKTVRYRIKPSVAALMFVQIRQETEQDIESIHKLNVLAFGQPLEARLVDSLRSGAHFFLSLVAVAQERIVGHILFTSVTIGSQKRSLQALGLGPMAVLPTMQRQGIGSTLVRRGLKESLGAGYGIVVVLGHPEYYPRFGFVPASRYGLTCEFNVPDEVFMALELIQGSLQGISGVVSYHSAFHDL